MGLATARAAAAAGAVVTIASGDPGRLGTALAGLPDTCDGAVVDTRSEADVAALFARVGELDHLVYTAGEPPRQRALQDLLWVPKTYATRRYSWMTPPTRLCRRTRK
jgi:NAD(P)-dependent dehydrogenase (short-subunit alcohol dehydrogenase family)